MLDVLLALAAAPFALAAAYLAILAIAARRIGAAPARYAHRFDVIVPAHDEEQGIVTTIRSLQAMDYPADRFRVIVVADNCTDATATRARAAGARVLVRHDPLQRGKGYALAHGCAMSLDDDFADALVFVDADTSVSPNLLSAFSARLAAGAECAQAEYGVRNPETTWRTRLMAIAYALYHTTRSLGRERLGLSCGLRGNGMMLIPSLLRRIPFQTFSPVEDVEYGLVLGLRGVRVAYVAEATVVADVPTRGADARSQRDRWERGRRALLARYVGPLLREGISQRDPVPLELAADLLVPPLVSLVMIVACGAIATAMLALTGHAASLALSAWSVAAAGVLVYVWRGMALAGAGPRAMLDLCWVPLYMLWKCVALVAPSRASRGEWVRTARSSQL